MHGLLGVGLFSQTYFTRLALLFYLFFGEDIVQGEWLNEWVKAFFATEITETIERKTQNLYVLCHPAPSCSRHERCGLTHQIRHSLTSAGNTKQKRPAEGL